MSDPTDLEVVDDVGFRTGHKICPVLVGNQQLEAAIDRSYRTGDLYDRLMQINPEDIKQPGTATRVPRREADPQQLQAQEQPPPAPGGEPELMLTAPSDEPQVSFMNRMQKLTDAISARSPESQGCVLQALIQLLISRGMIDPDELLRTIRSIAADRK